MAYFTTGSFVGAQSQVLVHQAVAATDSVLGNLTLNGTTLTGALSWSRVLQKTTERLYQPGFGPLPVVCFGARYNEPLPITTALVMGLTGGPSNARLIFGERRPTLRAIAHWSTACSFAVC